MPYKDKEKQRQYNKEYSEKNKQYYKDYRAENPEKFAQYRKTWNLKNKYNLTPEEHQALLESTNNSCTICKSTDLPLVVDHCHTTGDVRGVLCNFCNTGLGHFRDDPKRLSNAIEYLKSTSS